MKLLADSDATGYDPVTHYLYIADGGLDAKLDHTFPEIVNTDTGKQVGQIKIDSNRLEAMYVEKAGTRLFLNMTEKNSIGVIDRKKQAVAAVWPLSDCKVNASVAMDEKNHRLFAACRDGNMNVLDSDTGKVSAESSDLHRRGRHDVRSGQPQDLRGHRRRVRQCVPGDRSRTTTRRLEKLPPARWARPVCWFPR